MAEFTEKRVGAELTAPVASELLELLSSDDGDSVLAALARLRSGESDEELREFLDSCMETTKGRVFATSEGDSDRRVDQKAVKRNLDQALHLRTAHIIDASPDDLLIGPSDDELIAKFVAQLEHIENSDSPNFYYGNTLTVNQLIAHVRARTPDGRRVLKHYRQMVMAEKVEAEKSAPVGPIRRVGRRVREWFVSFGS